jgi:hypothetical protein
MPDRADDALPIAPSHLAHPWHGISPGAQAPVVLTVYIEIVPTDTVKYEVDKHSGHLRVDRPQKYSALCPALYGFVPRTLCGDAVGAFAASRAGRRDVAGDGDPMDVCVLTERAINRGGIIVSARPIGGFRMFDGSDFFRGEQRFGTGGLDAELAQDELREGAERGVLHRNVGVQRLAHARQDDAFDEGAAGPHEIGENQQDHQ